MLQLADDSGLESDFHIELRSQAGWVADAHDFVRYDSNVILSGQMHSVATSTLAWVGFCSFILVMLAIDLGVFNRKPHEISYRNAAVWSGVWVTLALIFFGLLLGPLGGQLFGDERHQKAFEFITGLSD